MIRKTTVVMLVVLMAIGVAVSPDTVSAAGPTAQSGGLYTCPKAMPSAAEYQAMAEQNISIAPAASALVAPLEDTFSLHSNPGATQILYIDWDGHNPGGYKAWSMDGNRNNFSDAEREVIQATWFSVSEDFLPFNIDVTTEEPPSGWLGQRAVVDGSRRYDYSWAYGGDWADTSDRLAYIFPGDDTWLWIADSISHEVGHTLNLGHDGRGGQEYYTGHGSGDTEWCPVMGWGAYSINGWSIGDYNGATNQQDDLAIITNVLGVDYRVDDHGGNIGSATPISLPTSSLQQAADGIISENSDVDYFAFSLSESTDVQISINEDAIIGASNLDVLAHIHNSGGGIIHTSDPVSLISASFDVTLAAGDYYISVDGTGWGTPMSNPPVGYSDYAILGYYSILALAGSGGGDTDPPTPNPASFASAPSADSDTAISMTATTGSDASGPVEYLFTETSGNSGGSSSSWQTSTSYTDSGLTAATQYTYTVTMRDALGNTGSASAPANATTTGGGCTPIDMHIAAVNCSEVNCGQGKRNGRVTVTIQDNCGNPVANALVDVSFTGDFNESFSNVATNASGQAVVTAAGCIKKPSFTVTVTDVTHGSLAYNSNDDVTNSCSG